MTATPSIVYMGTPEFAVPCFQALHRSPFKLKLVLTQPDRPKGRGRRLMPPPVKAAAQAEGYEVLQPPNVRDPELIRTLKAIAPDFLVVVAFGQILPAAILKIASRGAVNVHASLLPKYRGPAPIQWAIMRGETQSGITTMLMDTGVDTGDILLSASTPIHGDDTWSSLHDRLADLGAGLLVDTIDGMCTGTVLPRAQNHAQATYAPMLNKAHGRIDWSRPARTIDAQIRAMNPWPGAFCLFKNKRYKIHKAIVLSGTPISPPGTVIPGFPDELRIATGDGALSILEIQGESGKRLSTRQFLMGNPIALGAAFS